MASRCEYVDSDMCVYRYYVGIDEATFEFTDVHVEARRGEYLYVSMVEVPWSMVYNHNTCI